MTAQTLERIAHYRIVRRVGRGGMGIVYRAVDERDGRLAAVKLIRESDAEGDENASPRAAEARVRFDREAEILKSLLHANIVSFYEIGEDDGIPYLAMEFLDGLHLTSYAGRPYGETLPLLIQAAHGMEYLASRGIVHRDLSPENIFVVDSSGERIVKLLDFGIAKLFESSSSSGSLTATGFFLGKVAYGSPEQLGSLGSGAALDWRSDVYSLGVIFYQILSGRRPFEGKAPVEFIAAHLNLPAPPAAAPPDCPPLPIELVRLVAQMLEKKREARPRSYREIVDRMVAVLRNGVRSGAPLPGGKPLSEGKPVPTGTTLLVGPGHGAGGVRSGRGRRALVRTAAAVIAAAGLVSVFFYEGVHRRRGVVPSTKREPPVAAPSAFPAQPVEAGVDSSVKGELRIVATPFAEVVSVTDTVSGRAVRLGPGALTPLVLPVDPGTYRVVVRSDRLGGAEASGFATVVPGKPVLLALGLLPTDSLVETLR